MRYTVFQGVVLVGVLALIAAPAAGQPTDPLRVTILDAGMVSQSLRITMATTGLDDGDSERSTVGVSAWLDGVPFRATVPLIHMPARFAMELALADGVVRVGGISVGEFAPVRPFDENMHFPIEVTLRRGSRAATAREMVTIPLPTVIVPGYLNELAAPDEAVLDAFRRHGYRDKGLAPTLFWFPYPSLRLTLEEGARDLGAYVRQVVLPATFARKINVVGYSLGGLLARWNIAYDLDGWGALVNRLVLVGVPNEGAVMPYVYRRAPVFLPYAWWARTPAARELLPCFPFLRATSTDSWKTPSDGDNPLLARLNVRPIPSDIRMYIFYGSSDSRDSATGHTLVGMTGGSPSYGPGDGIVLAASAQGLPIQGGSGVPAFADREIPRVNLGSVGHMLLMRAGAERIVAALMDRMRDKVDEATNDH